MFGHVVNNLLYRNVDIILYDSLINVPNHALDDTELLEQFATGIQNFLGENVFFSVYPKVGKSFLRWVKDLGQIAECSFLVQNFVSLRELLSIVARGTAGLVYFAEAFHLI